MECLVRLQKRRLDEQPGDWGPPEQKRSCQGLDGDFQTEHNIPCTQLSWSSIDHQKPVQSARTISSIIGLPSIPKLTFLIQPGISKPCPRCLAGESGHINHILTGSD
ncbi:uncharacterized protein [Narcine bancroftii]|uniref:uncharacterized protein isoform X2 n=1 Tax=Narcine bancroftii TaxID=1343680 RepID=UPI003831D527